MWIPAEIQTPDQIGNALSLLLKVSLTKGDEGVLPFGVLSSHQKREARTRSALQARALVTDSSRPNIGIKLATLI